MRAAITGIGAVTTFGRGTDRLWSAMAAGEPGIRAIERFSTDAFAVRIAGVVPDRNAPAWDERGAELCFDLAIAAAREAIAAAGYTAAPQRVAFVLGTSLGDYDMPMYQLTAKLADALGAMGPRLTVSTACTSSTNALGIGLDLLEQGAADVVIAGGADVLSPLVLAGFHRLGVLSTTPCAPFSGPPGTSLGEGAGFCILERSSPRAKYGLYGYGLSSDAYHETGPDPSGVGIARAMRTALAHAGISPDAIDYVNAHGTGTVAGDPAEWRALKHVLGDRAEAVPVSSSKSFLGHAQGAAGVVELIATLVAIDHGTIPPTRNFTTARPNSPPDPVAGDVPRSHIAHHTLCNSSGFGGANCAVVTGPLAGIATTLARSPRPIYLTGCGVVGELATTPPLELKKAAPWVDPKHLDAMTLALCHATALALADAGLRIKGALPERSGLVIGTTRVSKESSDALRRSIDERGLPNLAAMMFSRMVLNAPVGACAKQHMLKGPLSTVSAGDLSGLAAIATAAHLLATRDDVDRIVAGGCEEDRDAPDPRTIAGAAGVVLQHAPPASGPRIRLARWSVGGPGPAAGTPRRAGSVAGTLDLVAAIAALRAGSVREVVVGEPNESLTCEFVFEREEVP